MYVAKRKDGTFETLVNGYPYHAIAGDPLFPSLAEQYADLAPGHADVDGVVMQDNRGRTGWLNGELFAMTAFGPLPEGFSDTPPLETARADKLARIDAETSAAILAGFDYEIDGQVLHFSYDSNDQQNFADTANASLLSKMGVPGVPASVTWNGWKIDGETRTLARLTLTPDAFLALYMGGALTHKATQMEIGGQRKAAAEAATTIEKVNAI